MQRKNSSIIPGKFFFLGWIWLARDLTIPVPLWSWLDCNKALIYCFLVRCTEKLFFFMINRIFISFLSKILEKRGVAGDLTCLIVFKIRGKSDFMPILAQFLQGRSKYNWKLKPSLWPRYIKNGNTYFLSLQTDVFKLENYKQIPKGFCFPFVSKSKRSGEK